MPTSKRRKQPASTTKPGLVLTLEDLGSLTSLCDLRYAMQRRFEIRETTARELASMQARLDEIDKELIQAQGELMKELLKATQLCQDMQRRTKEITDAVQQAESSIYAREA